MENLWETMGNLWQLTLELVRVVCTPTDGIRDYFQVIRGPGQVSRWFRGGGKVLPTSFWANMHQNYDFGHVWETYGKRWETYGNSHWSWLEWFVPQQTELE